MDPIKDSVVSSLIDYFLRHD